MTCDVRVVLVAMADQRGQCCCYSNNGIVRIDILMFTRFETVHACGSRGCVAYARGCVAYTPWFAWVCYVRAWVCCVHAYGTFTCNYAVYEYAVMYPCWSPFGPVWQPSYIVMQMYIGQCRQLHCALQHPRIPANLIG